MNLTEESSLDFEPLNKILASIPQADSNELIPFLQEIQNAYGYLPPPVLTELSTRTSIPASRIYGVATFYEQFYLEPRGRHTIRCCRGTACHVRSGSGIIEAIQNVLNVAPGETTENMRFTFETVACLGTCFLAPVIMVNKDYYGNLTPNKIQGILEKYE
jgi:NADH-quinone oxidoreductase subunit E